MPAGPSREGAFKKDEYVVIRKATIKWGRQGSKHVPVLSDLRTQLHPSMRAARILGDETYKIVVVSFKIRNDKDSYRDGDVRSRDIRNIMEHVVHEGIQQDGHRYTFLGYTESQLKATQFMMFEGDKAATQNLLRTFGKLDAVYQKSGYGKYAARLGLSFSSTAVGLDAPHNRVTEIPDLVARDGTLMSDGCGVIRDSILAIICANRGIRRDTHCIQIRWNGHKGMLVGYPDAFCTDVLHMGENWIAVRPSMKKYDGRLTPLEINAVSHPAGSARLNKMYILLLLTAKIPAATFHELLDEQLEKLALFMTDRDKAIEVLESTDSAQLDADGEGFYQDLFEALLAMHDLSEPYFKWLMLKYQKLRYRRLREKICIDVKLSWLLFGVVDESRTLKPDEVYVNIPHREGVIIGRVVVCRTPAYAPGDMRVFKAVNKPELQHHTNCIVFSGHESCPRSVTDMISGGDLDGDKFWVCSDPRLVPKPSNISPPSQRISPAAASTSRRNSLKDMPQAAIDTFVIQHGVALLGQISRKWTAHTANHPDLAASAESMKLASCFEAAVDLAKTGENQQQIQEDVNSIKTLYDPDTSSEARNPLQALVSDIPDSTLGEMEHWRPDPALILEDTNPQRYRELFKEGEKIMPKYNGELSAAIELDNQEKANTDLDEDSPSGPSSAPSSSQRSKSEPKKSELVKQSYINKYFSGRTSAEHADERLRASAWYEVGYKHKKKGFAWLGARQLNAIKAEASCGGKIPLVVGRRATPLSQTSSDFSSSSTLVTSPDPTLAQRSTVSTPSSSQNLMDVDSEPEPSPSPPTRPMTRSRAARSPPLTRPISQSSSSTNVASDPNPDPPTDSDSDSSSGDTDFYSYHSQSTVADDEVLPILPKSEDDLPGPSQGLDFSLRTAELPRHPVATEVPPCRTGALVVPHEWRVMPGATRSWRKYTCKKCDCIVKETKSKASGLWDAAGSSFDTGTVPIRETIRRAETSPIGPVTPAGGARGRPRIRAQDMTSPSSGTVTVATSTAPRSRGQALKNDTSSTTLARPEPLPMVLVADQPKPSLPVATPNLGICQGKPGVQHKWKSGGANGFSRKYVCEGCQMKVEEKKKDGRWISYDVIRR